MINSRKINILYVHGSLPLGGAEELRYILLKGINRKRFSPFVCCIKEKGPIGKRIENLGIPVIELGLSEKMYDFRAMVALFKLIKEYKFHIVQSCMFIATMFVTAPAKVLGVPIILSEEHCIEVWKKTHHKFIDMIMFPLLDKIIAVSEEVKKYMVCNEIVSCKKITVLPNTADQERFLGYSLVKDMRKELDIHPDCPVIGIIGRLHAQKGHIYLLRSLVRVKDTFPDVRLLIAGEGPLEQELKIVVKKERLENNVIFLGVQEDVPAIFKMIDIIVISSLYEGQSIVILEAMASAKPIIATNVGGTPELIENDKTGILVESRDINALAKSIIDLLTRKEYSKQLGLNAREKFINNFGSAKYVQRMEHLYGELLAKKRII